VFNNTPDETAFYRLTLEREGVQASMLMIQPTLTSFTFEGPPQPVLLDVASMRSDSPGAKTFFLCTCNFLILMVLLLSSSYQCKLLCCQQMTPADVCGLHLSCVHLAVLFTESLVGIVFSYLALLSVALELRTSSLIASPVVHCQDMFSCAPGPAAY